MPGTTPRPVLYCGSTVLLDEGTNSGCWWDIDTAAVGRGSESELAKGEMVAVSVGPCVEWSGVAAVSCFSTVMGEERGKDLIIGAVSNTSCRDDSCEKCMELGSGVNASKDDGSGAVEGEVVFRTV
jgi:hypothetical protein